MPNEIINLIVYGDPRPRGSKTALPNTQPIPWPPGYPPLIDPRTGKPYETVKRTDTGAVFVPMRDASSGSYAWMEKVKRAAVQAMGGRKPDPAKPPVKLTLDFYMERPQYHFGTGRNAGVLKSQFVNAKHTKAPDRLKLARAIEDSLIKRVFIDDAQTIDGPVRKHYCGAGELPRVEIQIEIAAVVPSVQKSLIGE